MNELIDYIVKLLIDKKASDILLLDLRRLSPIADYFLIATANSIPHAQALCDEIELKIKHDFGRLPHHIEGYNPAQWILIDYIEIVIHIFLKEIREFYGLERLWGDAPQKRYAE
ncbi:MAG: ribosome silencing factor [candidate division WOR-3 bacterium]|nr:ribosome silencing factor [candidate division WOR-3 bacterium]MCX7837298.1 ribosome silencing factor [candidate division WOR-3 bacterium]